MALPQQFHEGTGFLTHHLALTNSFEASLRAVDPAVTLPYWDFSIEGQVLRHQSSINKSSINPPPSPPSLHPPLSRYLSGTFPSKDR